MLQINAAARLVCAAKDLQAELADMQAQYNKLHKQMKQYKGNAPGELLEQMRKLDNSMAAVVEELNFDKKAKATDPKAKLKKELEDLQQRYHEHYQELKRHADAGTEPPGKLLETLRKLDNTMAAVVGELNSKA